MTDDFFRARIDQMIDLSHPLAVLARHLPWQQLEAAQAPCFARSAAQPGDGGAEEDLFDPVPAAAGAVSNAGRPRLALRLMVSLLYLKHAFGSSDEALVARWSENIAWQYFSGREYYEPRLPSDATQIGRFRRAIGEAGVEEILAATIDTAVQMKAIGPAELERVIVDSTVREKAVARQRTIVGRLLRNFERRVAGVGMTDEQFERLYNLFARVRRILTQRNKDKGKLYALHAPEVKWNASPRGKRPSATSSASRWAWRSPTRVASWWAHAPFPATPKRLSHGALLAQGE